MNIPKPVFYTAAILALAFPLFSGLEDLPVQLWDESRLIINSWEMYHNREFFVLHFNGEPDLWNTKPPLAIWMQTASIGLFGFNEFALRFPSAFCALLTALALVVFSHRVLGDKWVGLLAGLILVTTPGFNGIHVARTADFDAPLILFLTLSALYLFRFTEDHRNSSLFLAGVFTAAAVLTKGIAGFMFLPGMLLFLLLTGNTPLMFRKRGLYMGMVAAAVMVGGFYGLREFLEPGYLSAVWENEVGGRYFQVNEGHSGSPYYYIRPLLDNFWLWLLPLGLLPLISNTGARLRRMTAMCFCLTVVFFLLISASRTKLVWYAAPMYPFFTFVIAAGLAVLARRATLGAGIPMPVVLLLLASLFIQPVKQSVHFVRERTETPYSPIAPGNDPSYEMSRFLQSARGIEWDLGEVCLVGNGYQPHIDFYLLQRQWNGEGWRRCSRDQLGSGEAVLYWEVGIHEELAGRFELREIYRDFAVRFVRLEDLR